MIKSAQHWKSLVIAIMLLLVPLAGNTHTLSYDPPDGFSHQASVIIDFAYSPSSAPGEMEVETSLGKMITKFNTIEICSLTAMDINNTVNATLRAYRREKVDWRHA